MKLPTKDLVPEVAAIAEHVSLKLGLVRSNPVSISARDRDFDRGGKKGTAQGVRELVGHLSQHILPRELSSGSLPFSL